MLKRRGILYAALVLLIAIALTYHVRELIYLGVMVRTHDSVRGPFKVELSGITITSVESEAESAGVRAGDQLVAISGRPFRGMTDWIAALRGRHAGDRLDIQVRSSTGALRSASVELKAAKPLTTGRMALLAVGDLMPVFCIALGFWVAAVRIGDPIAWIFLGMMISFGETVGATTFEGLAGREDLLQPLLGGYQQFSANIWSVFMMFFGIYFPTRLAVDRRWPWMKWILAVPILVRATQYGLAGALLGTHVNAAISVQHLWQPGNLDPVLHLVAITSFFAAIGYKTFSATNPDSRRRLLLLWSGTTISVTPAVVVIAINMARGLPLLEDSAVDMFVLYLMLVGFPITIAYVILIQRAMDVRVVVRQGLQYFFASKGLVVLQVLLTAAIVMIVATTDQNLSPHIFKRQ